MLATSSEEVNYSWPLLYENPSLKPQRRKNSDVVAEVPKASLSHQLALETLFEEKPRSVARAALYKEWPSRRIAQDLPHLPLGRGLSQGRLLRKALIGSLLSGRLTETRGAYRRRLSYGEACWACHLHD